MQLNLYSVSDEYIEYLRNFDNRVYDNKQEKCLEYIKQKVI